jgi:predicted transposase YdaD
MRESVTFQAILEEGREQGREQGRVEELHRMILRQGRVRFGEPDEATQSEIEAIRDTGTLEDLSERLVIVSSWDELLG